MNKCNLRFREPLDVGFKDGLATRPRGLPSVRLNKQSNWIVGDCYGATSFLIAVVGIGVPCAMALASPRRLYDCLLSCCNGSLYRLHDSAMAARSRRPTDVNLSVRNHAKAFEVRH